MPRPDKIVRLALNPQGVPIPDQDPVNVISNIQRIKWVAAFPFTVEIWDYNDIQYGPGDADGSYGCLTGYFSEHRRYKYSITANGRTNDPDIQVLPGTEDGNDP